MNQAPETTPNSGEPSQACRQRLADTAVNREATAAERLRARVDLLCSYISDELIPPDEQPTFRERVSALVDGTDHIMHADRKLRQLEDQIYIPMREDAAARFDSLHKEKLDMTAGQLVKALVGPEIEEYRSLHPEAGQQTLLVALMRSSPCAEIIIQMARSMNDEDQVIAFSWRPQEWPLMGL